MRYKLANDARPQVLLLIFATLSAFALWFIPYVDNLVYPIRLFVTFVHESSHAIVALVTGGSVQSLTISADGSGVVYSTASGWFSGLLTSSAGYLGTTLFGVILLYLIRRSVSSNKLLFALGGMLGAVTLIFAIASPVFHILSLSVPFSNILFSAVAGLLLSGCLIALGKFASIQVANFSVSFLAIQCLLNSLADLKTVFIINAPFAGSDLQNDASNMAAATGVPGIVWAVIWIAISLVVILLGLRLYAVTRSPSSVDSLFEN